MRVPVLTAICLSAALLTAAAPADADAARRLGERGLRPGAKGSDVKTLQQLLTKAGFRTSADGDFGPATTRSVKGFQGAAQLTVSGVVGRVTVKALRSAVASVNPPASGGFSGDEETAPATTRPAATPPPASGTAGATKGSEVSEPQPVAGPTGTATINPDGTATPPKGAPKVIVDLFDAANRIATTPYRYGGGHQSFDDTAYDCSGSVSYALHGAGLLDRTMVSGELASYGRSGAGQWITIYANDEHVYMYVAGIRFDTSGQRNAGTRWQAATRSNEGFVVRHPAGL